MRSRRSGGRTPESRLDDAMDDTPPASRGEEEGEEEREEEREEGRGRNYLRGRDGWAGMCASILRIRWPTRIMAASTSSSFTCRPQARSIATISPSSRAASSSSLTQCLIRLTPVCDRAPVLPAMMRPFRVHIPLSLVERYRFRYVLADPSLQWCRHSDAENSAQSPAE